MSVGANEKHIWSERVVLMPGTWSCFVDRFAIDPEPIAEMQQQVAENRDDATVGCRPDVDEAISAIGDGGDDLMKKLLARHVRGERRVSVEAPARFVEGESILPFVFHQRPGVVSI